MLFSGRRKMDLYAKKILGFLQANPNLDLEATDIAFHLKLDEQFVQNYMSQLLRQGAVVNRKDEYGRIYWHTHDEESEIAVMEPVTVSNPGYNVEKKIENDELDSFLDNQKKKLPIINIMFIVALTAAFAALGYLGLESINGKINRVSDSMKQITDKIVVKTEYDQQKNEFSLKMIKMENEIRSLTQFG
jgi:predicted transcriptional regulator